MKIAIDAMGGDRAPNQIVAGVVKAAEQWPEISFIVVGDETSIRKEIEGSKVPPNVVVHHSTEVIATDEEPVRAIRRKKDASLVVACRLVKEQQADAIISAGNTGALMAAGLLLIGRIPGIERPALSPVFPTTSGGGMLVLDVGANMDAKPEHLADYARMGHIYARDILGVSNPRIGLLNVGTEDAKGNELAKATFPLLKELPINFIGNMEARGIPYGECDVLICDGFSGNVVLKMLEGVSAAIFDSLKVEFTSSTISKFAAAILKPGLKRLKKKMDYTEYGGAPLLGLNGICIKAHGSSDSTAIFNAIRQAKLFYDQDVLQQMRSLQEKGNV